MSKFPPQFHLPGITNIVEQSLWVCKFLCDVISKFNDYHFTILKLHVYLKFYSSGLNSESIFFIFFLNVKGYFSVMTFWINFTLTFKIDRSGRGICNLLQFFFVCNFKNFVMIYKLVDSHLNNFSFVSDGLCLIY